jgi:hypothetical protein
MLEQVPQVDVRWVSDPDPVLQMIESSRELIPITVEKGIPTCDQLLLNGVKRIGVVGLH